MWFTLPAPSWIDISVAAHYTDAVHCTIYGRRALAAIYLGNLGFIFGIVRYALSGIDSAWSQSDLQFESCHIAARDLCATYFGRHLLVFATDKDRGIAYIAVP